MSTEKKMLTGKSAGLCPRKHRLNSYLTEELWEHDCRLSACPRVVTANFQCPRHMMEVLRNQSSREFCYQTENMVFLGPQCLARSLHIYRLVS